MDTWNRLVSLTYGVEVDESKAMTQDYMLKEYEKVRNLRPQFKISKGGGIFISGLEVFNEKSEK